LAEIATSAYEKFTHAKLLYRLLFQWLDALFPVSSD
jgi:hypothetical protein